MKFRDKSKDKNNENAKPRAAFNRINDCHVNKANDINSKLLNTKTHIDIEINNKQHNVVDKTNKSDSR